jgi:hypothetical protein
MSDDSAADFMRDELEALLASKALMRVAERHSADSEPAPLSEEPPRNTQPRTNVQALRAALRAGLK